MCKNGHKYRKLNEHQLFCSRCGTTYNVGSNVWWTHPFRPWPQPYVWPQPYWYYTTTGASTSGSMTYTIWNDVANNVMGELNAEGREDTTAGTNGQENN